MNAFVPCHSSTPKSLSKSSVMVYQGISQPIRVFTRSMPFCDAREANASGIANVQMGDVCDLVGHHGAANTGMLGPTFHAGFEERAVEDQLTAALEQVEQAHLALGSVELVILLHGQPAHPTTHGVQLVPAPGRL